MNTFQSLGMTIVKILCVLLICREACCADAQIPDTKWYLGQNRFHSDPNEVNQLILHVISQQDRPQLVKRKLDRFRFFHKGIGKRSTEEVFDDNDQMNDEGDESSIHVELQGLSNGLNKFVNMIPSNLQYIYTKYPDFLSNERKNLRNLRGTKHWQRKRAPEYFSESLYPLQSGKQKLEATLDHTLNSNEEESNNLDDFDHSSVNEASLSNSNEVSNKLHKERNAIKSPFDIYFVSPDFEMDGETQTQDKNKIEDIKDTDTNVEQRSKKWWAANMLSRFRSQKSWNRRLSNTLHSDPAVYFLGLGR